ncbi:MAG: DUF4214 domain-containing protein [Desulfotignum sp.]|nr:DUF4214 domain-containing protein [Desulfotignum sp.]
MAITQTQVSKLYVAIFNRASEGSGNSFWQSFADMSTAADEMLATDDAKNYFGDSLDSDQAFIEHIYLNTLNKTPADDPDGIAFWVGQLQGGASRGEVVASLVEVIDSYAPGGINHDPDDAATVAAYNQFTNRVDISNYMADTVEETPEDYATSTAFDADLVVTDDPATVTAARQSVEDLVPEPEPDPDPQPDPGEAFTLTADVDDLPGTADADTFSAGLSAAGVQTLQTFDRLDGAEGIDTLNATLDGGSDFAGTGAMAAAVSNVENFYFRALGPELVNMNNLTGAEQIWSDRSQNNLTVEDVENLVTAGVVGGNETSGVPDSIFLLDYENPAIVTNAANANGRFTQVVVLDNASVILDITAGGVTSALSPSSTTVELALTDHSNVDFGTYLLQAAGLDTITTSGDSSIDLDLADTNNPGLGMHALDGDLTVMLGPGHDTLRLDGTDLDARDAIDLGDGSDTLVMSGFNGIFGNRFGDLDLRGVANADALGFSTAYNFGGSDTLDIEYRSQVTFEKTVLVNVLTVDTTAADLVLNFEAGSAGIGLKLSDNIANLTLGSGYDGFGNGANLNVTSLTNADDGDGNFDSLKTLTLVDANADPEDALFHSVTLGDGSTELDGLTSIDLTEAGQRAADGTVDMVRIRAFDAGFDSPVTIRLGEAELDYINDFSDKREIIQFTGEEISDVFIDAFNANAAGNGDKLDFSEYADVSGLGDLSLVDDGTSIFVSAASDQFIGTIELTGITGNAALQSVQDFGFIF